jgi:hypothetical protein
VNWYERLTTRLWHEIAVGHDLEIGTWYIRCVPCERAWLCPSVPTLDKDKMLRQELPEQRARYLCTAGPEAGFVTTSGIVSSDD